MAFVKNARNEQSTNNTNSNQRQAIGFLNISIPRKGEGKSRVGTNGLILLEGSPVADFIDHLFKSDPENAVERLRKALIIEYAPQDGSAEAPEFEV